MNKIKLGSLCMTKVSKTFDSSEGTFVIKKGTFVTVCDVDNIASGFVLVEAEGFNTVFDFNIEELRVVEY